MVKDGDLPEHDDPESDDDTPATRVVKSKIGQAALGDVTNFFEINPPHADTLIRVCAIMADIKELQKNSAKQSTVVN